jgi:hypothetical protein
MSALVLDLLRRRLCLSKTPCKAERFSSATGRQGREGKNSPRTTRGERI